MRSFLHIIIILSSLTTFSQKKKLIAIDTLENSHVLKIYQTHTLEAKKYEYHYLYDKNGGKLYYRKYSFYFSDYVGANMSSIVEEKITKRGKKAGIKSLKTKDKNRKPNSYYYKFSDTNLDTKKIDTIIHSNKMYAVNSDSLKWAVVENGSIVYKPILRNYKFDSVLIYKKIINGNLINITYSYPFSFEVLKSINFNPQNKIEYMQINEFYRDNLSIKRWIDCYFDSEKTEICKSFWRINKIKTKCKTINYE